MGKKKPIAEEDSLSFEDSLAELEQIVAKLEGGKLGLGDALSAYEHGVQRLKACFQMLQQAERRIEIVQSVDAQGQARTTPMDDDEEDDLTEKSAARSRRRTAKRGPATAGSVDDEVSLF